MFDIERQLAKAPEEVKQKMMTASASHKRYQAASKQCALWQEERELSAAAHTAAQNDWNECLNRWNPDTNELEEKKEAPTPLR